MTWVQPASASISALMSPVKAPLRRAWQSWPPSAMPLPAMTSHTCGQQRCRRADQQLAGRRFAPASALARSASSPASASPSARSPFIFQLPAMSFVRLVIRLFPCSTGAGTVSRIRDTTRRRRALTAFPTLRLMPPPSVDGRRGRVAQRESTPFTRVGSQVQSLSRPPSAGRDTASGRQARSSVAERS